MWQVSIDKGAGEEVAERLDETFQGRITCLFSLTALGLALSGEAFLELQIAGCSEQSEIHLMTCQNSKMAKGKKEAKTAKNSQSHIRARLDYLHQAALYFQSKSTLEKSESRQEDRNCDVRLAGGRISLQETSHVLERDQQAPPTNQEKTDEPLRNLSRVCVSHLRTVAMKTQIRLPVTLKRSVCKRCETIMVPGMTCSHETRNASRGGHKPWADVLVVRCFACGTEKRFPQTDKRAKKLAHRRREREEILLQDERHKRAPQVDTTTVSQQENVSQNDLNTPMLDVMDALAT